MIVIQLRGGDGLYGLAGIFGKDCCHQGKIAANNLSSLGWVLCRSGPRLPNFGNETSLVTAKLCCRSVVRFPFLGHLLGVRSQPWDPIRRRNFESGAHWSPENNDINTGSPPQVTRYVTP